MYGEKMPSTHSCMNAIIKRKHSFNVALGRVLRKFMLKSFNGFYKKKKKNNEYPTMISNIEAHQQTFIVYKMVYNVTRILP